MFKRINSSIHSLYCFLVSTEWMSVLLFIISSPSLSFGSDLLFFVYKIVYLNLLYFSNMLIHCCIIFLLGMLWLYPLSFSMLYWLSFYYRDCIISFCFHLWLVSCSGEYYFMLMCLWVFCDFFCYWFPISLNYYLVRWMGIVSIAFQLLMHMPWANM